jgi:hypothetical protein
MPYNKSVRVSGLAHTGGYCRLVNLRSVPRVEPAISITPAPSVNDAPCPACGAGGCQQHGTVKGQARYRCQNCYKIFSVSPVKPRIRRSDYERWLADMAS